MTKPIVYYVDDESRNLAVFEATLPSDWDIRVFDSPLKAIDAIKSGPEPSVIVSDQRMPGMSGVELLEKVRSIFPDSVRMIITGYSDEDLVVESVRKAQIFDYIRKPWDPEDLEKSILKGIQHYDLVKEKSRLFEELKTWVSPLALWAAENKDFKFPIQKDLVGIAFDIKDSSELHSVNVNGQSIRSAILQAFGESVLSNGGWTEAYSGDSGYANYGLMGLEKPFTSALKTAAEFKARLNQISGEFKRNIYCGIALHPARNSTVDLRVARVQGPTGVYTQKSFDTSSLDIDHLHRVEKLAHIVEGIHILCTRQFLEGYQAEKGDELAKFNELGTYTFKGSSDKIDVFSFGKYNPEFKAKLAEELSLLEKQADSYKKAA